MDTFEEFLDSTQMIGTSSFANGWSTFSLLKMFSWNFSNETSLAVGKKSRFYCQLTQLISTFLGRLVFGSFTRQKAYIILLLFKSSASSSMPPSMRKNQMKIMTSLKPIIIQFKFMYLKLFQMNSKKI